LEQEGIKETLKSKAGIKFLGESILVAQIWHIVQSNGNLSPSY